MYRLRLTLGVTLVVALLSGCLDVSQHISKDKRGLTNIYIKIGVSKAMMEMAKSESGTSGDGLGALDEISNNDWLKDLPEGIEVTKARIDNEMEQGVSMSFTMDIPKMIRQKLINQSESNPFLPIDRGSTVTIDMPASESPESSNEMSEPIMKAFKYRLTIGKSFLGSVSKVIVSSPKTSYEPDVIELPDMYLIEMPISYLMAGAGCRITVYK